MTPQTDLSSLPVPPNAVHRKHYAWQIAAVYVTLTLIAVSVAQVWYWMLLPAYPIELKRPIKIVEVDQFGSNNTLIYEMDYCKDNKYANLASVVHYRLVNHDGVLHEVPGDIMQLIPTGCNVVKIAIPIPLLKPGRFILTMVRVYPVNPLRSIAIESHTGEFVVPPPVLAAAQIGDPVTGKPKVRDSEGTLKK